MLPIFIILTLFMLAVFWTDATSFTIPNWLNLLVIALYPIFLLISPEPVDWLGGIYAFFTFFAVGYLIFAFGIMGGGDIKLLTALGLWVGWGDHTIQFVIYTAILGGLLSLFLLVGRPLSFWVFGKIAGAERIPKVLQKDEPVPYGLAIAGTFIIMLWKNMLPNLGI